MARTRPRPHACFYPGVQFNLPFRFTILDPSPDPVTTGDLVAVLRRSSMSRTSQLRLWCIHLTTPVFAKGVIHFSLP